MVKSKMLFILIGNNNTGKTTLQRKLVLKICGNRYDKLLSNTVFGIKHPEIKRKYSDIFFINRSFQEKKAVYISVDDYFKNPDHFKPADIAILSSHLDSNDIDEIISCSKQRFYNIFGVFFSNSIKWNDSINSQISNLNWDERLILDNEPVEENNEEDRKIIIDRRLEEAADSLVTFIINRTNIS